MLGGLEDGPKLRLQRTLGHKRVSSAHFHDVPEHQRPPPDRCPLWVCRVVACAVVVGLLLTGVWYATGVASKATLRAQTMRRVDDWARMTTIDRLCIQRVDVLARTRVNECTLSTEVDGCNIVHGRLRNGRSLLSARWLVRGKRVDVDVGDGRTQSLANEVDVTALDTETGAVWTDVLYDQDAWCVQLLPQLGGGTL